MESGAASDATRVSVAEAFLEQLGALGIEYLYLGAGSDTAPFVEAYRKAGPDGGTGRKYPKPVISAHETVAIGMAHGYTMVTGRMQAVMLHVSVGAANAVCGIINAARANVPVLFTAGRTPVFETGPRGSRDSEIHWAQEMFDQAGMMREVVKWDYELRDGRQLETVLNRAFSIADAHPKGPVYLTLPREVLASEAVTATAAAGPVRATAAPGPDPEAVRQLAQRLVVARCPVFVCTASGADPETIPILARICERFGIGVGEARPRYVCFPDRHPMHLGHDQKFVYQHADALVYLESDVPWVPARAQPKESAFIAHVGVDPLFARYPIRSHRSDLTITSSTRSFLLLLENMLEQLLGEDGGGDRVGRMADLAREQRARVDARIRAEAERKGPISRAYLSACLAETLPSGGIVVNEYPAVRECLEFGAGGGYLSHAASAGLGWGLPAALGAKQAAPDRQVVAFLGDGSYVFANPPACHHAAAYHDLPVVVVIFNNGGWGAVQNAALNMYPEVREGMAEGGDTYLPLTSLAPLPDFSLYAQASGGLGITVSERSQLRPALQRAFEVAGGERRQVLVNVLGQG